ncbi:MAG: AraC family transcriptional regulator ligand-binding domain-containing protein [Pseudomonadota bacterium]
MSDRNQRSGLFSGLFAVVFAFGQSRGLGIDDMAAASGVSPLEIMNPDKRFPDRAMLALWKLIIKTDKDSTLPLKFVQGAPMTVYAGLAEGARFADTLGTALEHMTRNDVLIGDRVAINIRQAPDTPILSVRHPLDIEDDGYLSAIGVFLINRLIRDVLGVDDAPVSVRLRLPPSAAKEEFEAFFQCPVQLAETVNEIELNRGAYEREINHANAELFAYVDAYFARRREVLDPSHPKSRLQRLRDAIVEQSISSDYTAGSVAKRANLSLRSAQRLALKEGFTLQKLIDEVRFENAKAMLENFDLSINQIANALSYSDDRSFRRAFKRKTGMSPTDYRKSRQ